jgi:hypothetical protein
MTPVFKQFYPELVSIIYCMHRNIYGMHVLLFWITSLPAILLTKAKQFAVKYQDPKFFNYLNSEILDSPSISTFQLKLNKYLLSLYS